MAKFFTLIIFSWLLTGCQLKKDTANTLNALIGLPAIEQGRQAIDKLMVSQAQDIFKQQQAIGDDFSQGPCLSENLASGWVADIAHNPRQPVDDQPENQCQKYRNGEAQHFVELDTDGNLIRVQ